VTIWVKLRDISNTFEQESIAKLTCSCYQLIKLSISSKHIGVSLVGCQIDRQCNKFLSYNWFWAMDDQLVHQWNTIGVSEGSFCFILKT
jgi:hypothetical protein